MIGFGGIPIQRVNHAAAQEIMKSPEAKINFLTPLGPFRQRGKDGPRLGNTVTK